jgi:hydroxypyruvate reductase
LTLEDKQRINRDLLNSGANIGEMNCVRKHLSRIKGGRLAAACAPAQVVTLTISDVPGDDPSVIASGPTVPDVTTCADAWAILQRYKIAVPAAIEAALKAGALETPKPNAQWAKQPVHLIATPQQSLDAAAELARAAGLNAYVLSDELEGESREVGKVHAALARAAAHGKGPFKKPCVILSGGETTVTIRPQVPGTPMALMASKTTLAHVCRPTPWPAPKRQVSKPLTVLTATMLMASLMLWATWSSLGRRTPM